MGMRWRGFRRVRGQVCKRIVRRFRELGLESFDAYRIWLEAHEEEWRALDGLCRVTITRFWRDRAVFDALRDEVLPALAAPLRALSLGCASGEEPYSVALASPSIEVIALEADARLLERARAGRYARATLRELAPERITEAFVEQGDALVLRDAVRERVHFSCADVRAPLPRGPFAVVLCRNVAFTYFAEAEQHEMLARIDGVLAGGGVLVIGSHESLPVGAPFAPWPRQRSIFTRTGAGTR
jgi:chemotaxis protein methyltransferase CheR